MLPLLFSLMIQYQETTAEIVKSVSNPLKLLNIISIMLTETPYKLALLSS